MNEGMVWQQVHGAFDLLGLAQKPAAPVSLPAGAPPQFEVPWGSFHQSLASSAGALLAGPTAPRKFLSGEFFRDCWIERRIPLTAVLAAALWHVVFFIFPWPNLPAARRHSPEFENAQLVWSGPIDDLPLLELPERAAMPEKKPRPSPRRAPETPPPAGAFHPRQRIFTDSSQPTHPRQTLIRPAAPPEAPKLLPDLPNIVQLAPAAQPARPRIAISEQALARLRPREQRTAALAASAPAPDLPNLEPQLGDLSIASSAGAPQKPKLQINPASAPRTAPRGPTAEAAPAPEFAPALPGAAAGDSETLIALSATSAAPAPAVVVPRGNLSARVSVSPEGSPAAPRATSGSGSALAPGNNGSAGTAAAGNSPAVSISGGHPEKSNVVSGLGGKALSLRVLPVHALPGHPQPRADATDTPPRYTPPNFAALPPGAKPEAVFGPKRIYTLHVNMPNLNSVTGSWVLNFSELRQDPEAPPALSAADLAGPLPRHKVDPKYPPSLIQERIEGEVILYAVIRRDGSVDSIQLVHGIDQRLDASAMDALAHWQFHPAQRAGSPVELEAIVRIPFRAVARPY
ncbi:MAG: TonB family protein [Acidobacteriia bacterium]|nr:TonB family protein [Terriglobia bacterium]